MRGPSVDGELQLRLENRKMAETLRQNLKVRSLFVPTSSAYPARSRVRVRIFGPQTAEPAELIAEVVFVSPQGLGLQVLELGPEDQAKLNRILDPAPEVKPPEPQRTAPPPAPSESPAPAKPSPSRISVPPTGTLTSDLPAILLQMAHKEPSPGQESEMPLDTSLGLFLRLAQNRFTGCLTVASEGKVTIRLYFRDGFAVGGHHEPEEETASLGYALRKAGKLPEADYRDTRRKHAETKEPEVKLLSAICDAPSLQKAWRTVIFQNVGKCLSAKKSHYRIEEGGHHLSKTMPLPVQLHRVLFRGIIEAASAYSNDQLYAGLEPYLNLYVSKKGKLPVDFQQLRLDEKELRFLNVTLVTPTRLRAIFSVSALNRSQTLRVLYALFFLKCLNFATHYLPPEKEFLPHLNRVWSELQSATHYDVLQVHWTTLGPAIEAAYLRTKKGWEETQKTYQNKPNYLEIINKILGRIEESFRFLSDDHRRRGYRDQIIEAPKRAFSAELLSQHTRTYLLRGNRKEARIYIEMALDIAPGNAEYRSLLRDCGG